MKYSSRRDFLQSSMIMMAAAFLPTSYSPIKYTPRLSFSTLGCPDWEFSQIVAFAAEHNYSGLELRGIKRELDLLKCPEFNSPPHIAATMQMMQDNGLHFVDLGSSATLHFPEGAERRKNIEDGKRFIDLAAALKCPYVRVFPNNFLKERSKEETIGLISNGLLELADHAKGTAVTVLVESHGDLVWTDDLEKVMQLANHDHVGMIWDVVNMYSITRQPPATVYGRLGKYIKHTHIKDAKQIAKQLDYVLLGQGDMPIFEAIDILANGGYQGYFSFEWEKLWHPDIAAPEIAIGDYSMTMKKHFEQAGY